MDRLWGFRVILDRQAVQDDLLACPPKKCRPDRGAVCQRDTAGDGRKVSHLCRQLQHIHHIGDLWQGLPLTYSRIISKISQRRGMGSTILPSGVKNAPFE